MFQFTRRFCLSVVFSVMVPGWAACADRVPITDVLTLSGATRGGRSPIQIDPVQAMMAAGSWKAPAVGDEVVGADGKPHAWVKQHSDTGLFEGEAFAGSYALATVQSDADRIALLDARGHSLVYVNGVPRMGDPYGFGFMQLPISLRAGDNELLFVCGRGQLRAAIDDLPATTAWLNTSDYTTPDLVAGRAPAAEEGTAHLSLPVLNATDGWLRGLSVDVEMGGEHATIALPDLPPLGSIKPALTLPEIVPAPLPDGTVPVTLTLYSDSGGARERLHGLISYLPVVAPDAKRKVTHVSGVDESVQYYAVVPPIGWTPEADVAPDARPGLLLSLHGASVEATNQARCYAPRPTVAFACATNRRPYGFDWEDWGRIDAIDVREHANALFNTDPRKQWLSGHSMGGHGTMIVGAQRPDLFASIGPSAGWIDFWSYTGAPAIPMDRGIGQLLHHAQNASRTLLLKDNYASERVYILHGDADDNVPVAQSRILRRVLGEFHPDFSYYEEPGAGHWWGDQCVDWPPMIDYLTAESLPEPDSVSSGSFVTISPAIMSGGHGVRVLQQWESLAPSRVTWSVAAGSAEQPVTITMTTENVALLSVETDIDGEPSEIRVEIDGQRVITQERGGGVQALLARDGEERWSIVNPPQGWEMSAKHPLRTGPFKTAFDRGAVLVCATGGDAAHNAWALAKARFDSEQFWYRGNGRLPVLTDSEYLAQRRGDIGAGAGAVSLDGCNVILYGRSDTNLAWRTLLPRSPLLPQAHAVHLEASGGGEDTMVQFDGDDAVLLMVQPGPDAPAQSIGVIAPTGSAGEVLSMRLPCFVAGVHYPDWSVIRAASLTSGLDGWSAAGFFGNDWQVDLDQSALPMAP